MNKPIRRRKIMFYCMARSDPDFAFGLIWSSLVHLQGYRVIFCHSLQVPSKAENQDDVCCFCCTSGPITTSVQTDKRGYVSGETIRLTGLVENNSSSTINEISITLVQVSYLLQIFRHSIHHVKCTVQPLLGDTILPSTVSLHFVQNHWL